MASCLDHTRRAAGPACCSTVTVSQPLTRRGRRVAPTLLRTAAVTSSGPATSPALIKTPAASRQQGRRPHVRASASLGQSSSEASGQPLQLGAVAAYLVALYDFSRPHTMVGTALSVTSISSLALGGVPLGAAAVQAYLAALVSALLMNVSIVGINQLFDIEIDRINKPDLPLASGALTVQQGVLIVVAATLLSFAIGAASGTAALNGTLMVSLLLGVLYSADLPFMRWKRSPVLAAGCILAVRAVIVQLGFYTHMRLALGLPQQLELTSPVVFTMGFMLLFSVVIAFFKDIPDVAGDSRAGVRTLSVRLGERRVFWVCLGLLSAAYAGAVVFCLLYAPASTRPLVCAGHMLLGGLLWRTALRVDPGKKGDLVAFYMFIWKLFYAEYLLIPFLG